MMSAVCHIQHAEYIIQALAIYYLAFNRKDPSYKHLSFIHSSHPFIYSFIGLINKTTFNKCSGYYLVFISHSYLSWVLIQIAL